MQDCVEAHGPSESSYSSMGSLGGGPQKEGPTEERVLPLSLTESRTPKRECPQQLTAGLLPSYPLAHESKPKAGVAPDTLVVHKHACRQDTHTHIHRCDACALGSGLPCNDGSAAALLHSRAHDRCHRSGFLRRGHLGGLQPLA